MPCRPVISNTSLSSSSALAFTCLLMSLFSCCLEPAHSLQLDSSAGTCDFPAYLNRRGPWLFEYRQSRDLATGERLAAGEIRYAEANLPSSQNLGTILLKRFQIRLIKGVQTYRESVLAEHREYLDCVERSAVVSDAETFVAAHYHTENSTKRLSGYICIAFSEKIDQHSLRTFAIAVYTGQAQLYRFSVELCSRGEFNDKWLWTPEPNIADFKAVQCPRTFSYRAIIDWVDARNESAIRLTNTRSDGSILQRNTFTLLQSQCIYGTGITWLFYNILPGSYRRSALLSFDPEISTQASIQEDMQCAGSWIKNISQQSYQFTLVYRPDFPQAIYTLRLPTDEPAQANYSQAMLYEGAVEVLSPGPHSNLKPTRRHLLSGDELPHNRFQLNYRKSLGDCDNHIRGCEFSEQHHLTNSMDAGRINMYCKYSRDLDGNQCTTNSNMGRCTYSEDIRGNWVRPNHQGRHLGNLGRVSIGFDNVGALMRLNGWGDARFPATDFFCRKNFLLSPTTVSEGVYVIRKVTDRMCASTQSCMQVLPADRGGISADGRLQSLKNVIFIRISHDTTLSENEVPDTCSFKEKLIEQTMTNGAVRMTAVSYFYTLLADALVRPNDHSLFAPKPSSMYCKINLYSKYNFSTANSSYPCLMRIQSESSAYDSFSFKFMQGSDMCESELAFIMKKHTCLGGFDINNGAFSSSISSIAFQFHVVVTYHMEGSLKLFNCWLIEKNRYQSVSRMLAFKTSHCGLLFAADASSASGSAVESPAYLESVEEDAAAVALHSPTGYPERARMDLVRDADTKRLQHKSNSWRLSTEADTSNANSGLEQQQQASASTSSGAGVAQANADATRLNNPRNSGVTVSIATTATLVAANFNFIRFLLF